MEKVISKIKSMFHEELLRYIAAICETKRIESNNQKMIVLGDLLYSNGIDFEILGGATNRIALQIDGYAVKFAMDEQGYQDNLIEYALSPELQPFVTKSYETNGYIQVQECVEVMNKSAFQVYKTEIYKILDSLCQDYLLGDVGFLEKNRTNWGIRNNKPVILDYAYCHRATENLFTCDRCGSPLRYDSTYDKLMCSDRSACKAIYTYNERKRIQGNQVDIDMIRDRKAESIKLGKGETFKEIEMFEDRLISDKYVIIDCPADMHRYNKMKEDAMMQISINGGDDNMTGLEERFAAMVDLAKNPNDVKAKEIIMSSITEEVPEPIYTENYQDNYMYEETRGLRMYNFGNGDDEEDESYDEADDFDIEDALSSMIDKVKCERAAEESMYQEAASSQLKEYLDKRNSSENREQKPEETKAENEDVKETDNIDKSEKGLSDEVTIETKVEINEEPEEASIKVETKSSNIEEPVILLNGKPIALGEEVNV